MGYKATMNAESTNLIALGSETGTQKSAYVWKINERSEENKSCVYRQKYFCLFTNTAVLFKYDVQGRIQHIVSEK